MFNLVLDKSVLCLGLISELEPNSNQIVIGCRKKHAASRGFPVIARLSYNAAT